MYSNQAFLEGIITDKKGVIKPDHIIIFSPLPKISGHLTPIIKQTKDAKLPNHPAAAKRYIWTGL